MGYIISLTSHLTPPCIWGVGSNPEFGIVAKYSTMTMTMTMAQYSDKYVFSFEKKRMNQ